MLKGRQSIKALYPPQGIIEAQDGRRNDGTLGMATRAAIWFQMQGTGNIVPTQSCLEVCFSFRFVLCSIEIKLSSLFTHLDKAIDTASTTYITGKYESNRQETACGSYGKIYLMQRSQEMACVHICKCIS